MLGQIVELLRARMIMRYRNAVLGVFWVVLQPILLFCIHYLIFSRIIHAERYYVFLLSGFFPWFFFQQTLVMGVGCFQQYAALLKNTRVHPAVLITALVLDNVVSQILSMTALLLLTFLWGGGWVWVSFPALLLAVFLLSVGTLFLTWACAILQIFFEDTRFVLTFGLQILFFATPVFYPTAILPEVFRFWIGWNPVSIWLGMFRVSLGFAPDPSGPLAASGFIFSASAILVTLAAGACLGLWRRKKNAFYFKL